MFPGLLLQTLEWGVSLVKHWSDFKSFFIIMLLVVFLFVKTFNGTEIGIVLLMFWQDNNRKSTVRSPLLSPIFI